MVTIKLQANIGYVSMAITGERLRSTMVNCGTLAMNRFVNPGEVKFGSL